VCLLAIGSTLVYSRRRSGAFGAFVAFVANSRRSPGAFVEADGDFVEGAFVEGAFVEGAFVEAPPVPDNSRRKSGAFGAFVAFVANSRRSSGAFVEADGAFVEGAFVEGACVEGAFVVEAPSVPGNSRRKSGAFGAFVAFVANSRRSPGAFVDADGAFVEGAFVEGAFVEGAFVEVPVLEAPALATTKRTVIKLNFIFWYCWKRAQK
jgi:hypothetical protein